MTAVILKKGKEKILFQKHHWLFSGAIATFPKNFINGAIYPVLSHELQHLGYAYFNRHTSLCGRIINFDSTDPHAAIFKHIQNAIALRQHLFSSSHTTAYRLVHGEADSLPGLIVDQYDDYLVFQIGTLGMEKLKSFLIESFLKLYPYKGIYEKSDLPSRKEEGLKSFEGLLFGTIPERIIIKEEGKSFCVNVAEGQKTGFFLDQREMRSLVHSLAPGKRVLNCFSYTGGFSLAALANHALHVDSVDSSEKALQVLKQNIEMNGFALEKNGLYCEDVFDFLRKQETLAYELVILDPPAFAKKKEDIKKAAIGYKEINRQAFLKMPPKSLLLTCSCSYHLSKELFQMLIFQAALEAKRNVKILSHHRLAYDHPISVFHPETDYLKSFLLYLE